MSEPKIQVLVIDDSAHNRRAITLLLESAPDIQVIDRASDGEEGLKKAIARKPDVITLDLEMPKLDGFAFLRLLMANAPTPVIVLSSYAHKSDVFKALELGAIDFIAKPRHPGRGELDALGTELLEKVRSVRTMRPAERRTATPAKQPWVICVGASTGGPPAIQRLVESLSSEPNVCLLVAQHMPAKFTEAFAERLDRVSSFSVSEARDGDAVAAGRVLIAPGGRHLELVRRADSLRLKTFASEPSDKHAPSVDRLFSSAAAVLADASFGVVLTGMGADGAVGVVAIQRAGGEVWAESEETAVIPGMPREAVRTGAVRRVLALPELGPTLAQLARRKAKAGATPSTAR